MLIDSLWLAVGAVLVFEIYAHVLISAWWLIGTYPLLLCLGYVLYVFNKRREFHRKHLDYRALAEGLRVQFYWSFAGLKEKAHEEYLIQHRSELDWIRGALRSVTLTADAEEGEARRADHATLAMISNEWVREQWRFFRRAFKRDHRKLKRQHNLVLLTLSIGIALGVFQTAVHIRWGRPEWTEAIVVLLGFFPALAVVLATYGEKMGLAPQMRRYEWMRALFGRARRAISGHLEIGDLDGAASVLKDIGIEALKENGDWVMIHRDREMEPHSA